MTITRKYILICHYSSDSKETIYESARCESSTRKETIFRLIRWARQRADSCQIPGCQCRYDTALISSEMTPEMKASGKYDNMVEVR